MHRRANWEIPGSGLGSAPERALGNCGALGLSCTAVAAIQLRMRMRCVTRPEHSLAIFSNQIPNKKLRIQRCEGIR